MSSSLVTEGSVTAPDGTRIGYRDHGGHGRGLLLLHGGGANPESMDQYAPGWVSNVDVSPSTSGAAVAPTIHLVSG